MRHPAFRAAYFLAYQVDLAMARRVDPHETLVVSGFWRSGTTWLQNGLAEILRAKMVFEPFQNYNREMEPVYALAGTSLAEPLTNMFMPYVPAGAPADHPVFSLVEKALSSRLRHRYSRVYRPGLLDSFRPRVLVKFTRAALSLRAIQDHFQVPVLHIRRDPRAVVASVIYKTNRMGGNFKDNFNLEKNLLGMSDGRADVFSAFAPQIRGFRGKPLAIRIAAYWALTERTLSDSYHGELPPRTRMIQYEAIAPDPARIIPGLLQDLGYPEPDPKRLSVLDANSKTTRGDQTRQEQLSGWKQILPSGESAEIAAIARDFGLGEALVD